MPLRRNLTEQQRDAILRRAGELDADGQWLLSCRQIADHHHLSHRAVERAIRQAAVLYGKSTAWRDASGD